MNEEIFESNSSIATNKIENIIKESEEDVHQPQSFSYKLFNPRGKLHRFLALFFMCFLGFGSYFCYDNPSALKDNFTKDLKLNEVQYSLFYSLYSWPTVITCFVGGILIDTVFGIRLGACIYMTITFLGQILFATGAIFNLFWLMCIGRFFFGIGAEPLAVAQNNYAVLWFKGKELNMVFGLQLSLARLGSAVNFWVMKPLYDAITKVFKGYFGLGITLFLASFTCVFSLLFSIILAFIDKRADRALNRSHNTVPEVIRFKTIREFKLTFWIVTLVVVSYYVAIFPFIAFGETFFKTKFDVDDRTANFINSLVYLISSFASPILGYVVDRCGKNLFWVMLSIYLTAIAHFLLAFTQFTPYIGMILMGISYSMLASSLWPLVSLIIPKSQLGTAYGLCQSVQNLGLALSTYVAGHIISNAGYVWLEVFFIICLILSFLLSYSIWIIDSLSTGILNMTPAKRELYLNTLSENDSSDREKLLATTSSEIPDSEFIGDRQY